MSETVKKILDLVKYQENSVISRILIENKSGTVTLFAFDKGEKLSEHTAPFEALVYILQGEVKVKISGNDYELTGGEMVVIPANKPHSIASIEKSKPFLRMLRSKTNNRLEGEDERFNIS